MGQPVLSGLICSHGTRVLFRTTRQVKLTNAGPELLACSSISLDDFAAAAAAVRAVALGHDAAARVGITRQELSTAAFIYLCPRRDGQHRRRHDRG